MKLITGLFVFATSLLAMHLNAYAGVSLDRTRIIYNESDRNQVINIINNSDKLYLVQNMILTDFSDNRSEAAAQFVTIPPLARLEKQSVNGIKLLSKDLSSQPADRESLFFFAVNLIPEGKRTESGKNDIATNFNIATKMVIKVFYRPSAIAGNVDDLAGHLNFHSTGDQLSIRNPSGYYYTLEYLSLDGKTYHADRAPMIAPFSTLTLPVKDPIHQVEWRVINDYGSASKLFSAGVEK